ncbi:MAG: hypothetical protein GY705_00295 [Bacteroidetes bacterium]|nr:hypothetical protein [Bacteroidota bacterium]
MKSPFLILFFILPVTSSNGQKYDNTDEQALSSLIEYSEQFYGTSDLLVNGRIYTTTHPKAKGHPYFSTEDWTKGTIYIKDKTFDNADLNYNIEIGKLILKEKIKTGHFIKIQVIYAFVDSFYMGQHLFVKLPESASDNEFSNFLEQVYTGGFIFLIHREKVFKKIYSPSAPYGEYSKAYSTFLIYKDGAVHKIPNKKAFLNFFKARKKEVKKFMKQHKIRLKKANNVSLHQLMKFCDG